MPIRQYHRIELFLPPEIDLANHVVLSEGQSPALGARPGFGGNLEDLFDGGI